MSPPPSTSLLRRAVVAGFQAYPHRLLRLAASVSFSPPPPNFSSSAAITALSPGPHPFPTPRSSSCFLAVVPLRCSLNLRASIAPLVPRFTFVPQPSKIY
ncbi:hypothetical protein LR48_Vigan09g120600 [Vigna angularis]|uniref:Uncharacterized protein n=1 Tax=Phaseolus angularis TaxID=3914 RepID=A0A0L9VCB1_PHAAN|nr:hypothetical protein LR48_Vigan09g120600 [Vigna angularis]